MKAAARDIFDAEPGGPAERTAARLDRHPLVDSGVVLVAAYVALSMAMVALGLVLVHVFVHRGLGTWDDDVTSWLADHRRTGVDTVTSWATYIANTEAVVGVAVVVSALLLLWHRRREVIVLMGGLGVEVTVFLTTNYVVDRPRPDVPRLNATPSTSSFPSGHVAASVVLWAAIALTVGVVTTNRVARTLAWLSAVVLPVLVAFARVYRGMHHPTDVLAGALLGALGLAASIFATRVGAAAAARRRTVSHAMAAAEPAAFKTAGAR